MNHMKKTVDLRQKLIGRGSRGSEVDFIEWREKQIGPRRLMPVTN